MLFVLQTPSLQHLAGVKIVTCLWSQRDVFTQTAPSDRPDYGLRNSLQWKAIEEKVSSKVSALPIPEQCKKQLLHFTMPIGKKFREWCRYHNGESDNFQALDTLLPQQLRWTMHGTIDYAKTAQLMVKDERLSVERRYELACINCLEEEARQLFDIMGEERRQIGMRNVVSRHHEELITYFTCILSGKARRLNRHFKRRLSPGESVNKYLFEATLDNGNRATCEYLFNKLNRRDKERVVTNEKEEDILNLTQVPTCNAAYYLSLLNEEQQKVVVRKYSYYMIVTLLAWPMQSLIVAAAKRGWADVDEYSCVDALHHIVDKMKLGVEDYDYAQLFGQCWRLTSAECKRRFLWDTGVIVLDLKRGALDSLFGTSKEEFIRQVLKEALSDQILELCCRYDEFSAALIDESVISEAALMGCKETAALESSIDPKNVEKRLKSEYVSRLVDIVIEDRRRRL